MPRAAKKELVGTIDCTPTWSEILPWLVELYVIGNATGMDELRRMAKIADAYVTLRKKEGK